MPSSSRGRSPSGRAQSRFAEDSVEPADVVAAAEPYAPDARSLYALALADVPALKDYFCGLSVPFAWR